MNIEKYIGKHCKYTYNQSIGASSVYKSMNCYIDRKSENWIRMYHNHSKFGADNRQESSLSYNRWFSFPQTTIENIIREGRLEIIE